MAAQRCQQQQGIEGGLLQGVVGWCPAAVAFVALNGQLHLMAAVG